MSSRMKVVLVRHGESTSTMENPQRPLAITGRQHAERMASWLHDCGYEVEKVLHSSKLRARQTAKIFGSRLDLHAGRVREISGINPNDPPEPIAEQIEQASGSLLMVSHLPFLNRLASYLLSEDPHRLQFQFSDAGTLILTRVGSGWRIEAVVGHQMV